MMTKNGMFLMVVFFFIRLSQLQGGQSREKTLREEREHRQRQMTILQRDVATLPPEAVAELIGSADYSGSRRMMISETQSPSSVLLNWLWGKSSSPQNT